MSTLVYGAGAPTNMIARGCGRSPECSPCGGKGSQASACVRLGLPEWSLASPRSIRQFITPLSSGARLAPPTCWRQPHAGRARSATFAGTGSEMFQACFGCMLTLSAALAKSASSLPAPESSTLCEPDACLRILCQSVRCCIGGLGQHVLALTSRGVLRMAPLAGFGSNCQARGRIPQASLLSQVLAIVFVLSALPSFRGVLCAVPVGPCGDVVRKAQLWSYARASVHGLWEARYDTICRRPSEHSSHTRLICYPSDASRRIVRQLGHTSQTHRCAIALVRLNLGIFE